MASENSFQSKYWCYTSYETHLNPLDYLQEYSYNVYGIESCPSTGRTHHQGYVEFKSKVRFSTLHNKYPRFHWTARSGTAEQATVYCKKDGNWFQSGEISAPRQGKRKDLDVVRDTISSGGSLADVLETASSYQACKFAQLYIANKRVAKEPPKVYWYWGPTGSGKTRTAYEQSTDPWMSGVDLKWFDGYNGEADVIIDDFRKDFCTFHFLLRLLDRYPLRVNIKGGTVQWVPKRIFITCPLPPRAVYDTREDIEQLMRRITEVKEFGVPVTEVEGNTSPRLSSQQSSEGLIIYDPFNTHQLFTCPNNPNM